MNAPFHGKRKPKVSLETLRRENVSCIRKLRSLAGRGPLPGDRFSCKPQQLSVLGGSWAEPWRAQARTGRQAGGAHCARRPGGSWAKRTAPATPWEAGTSRGRRELSASRGAGSAFHNLSGRVGGVCGSLSRTHGAPGDLPPPTPTLKGDARVVDQHVEPPVLLA